jgi:membrane associated rhomboid family serine protease
MVSTFVYEVETQPATLSSIIVMVLIFLYQYDYAIPVEKFAQEYDRQIVDREWWRVLTSTYSHQGVFHLAMNMCSMWYLGVMERYWGTKVWLRYTLLLILLSNALMLVIQAIQRHFRPQQGPKYTVGYSGQ